MHSNLILSTFDNCISTSYSTTVSGDVLLYLQLLSPYYPDIKAWYLNKVMPGLLTGTRHLEIVRLKGEIIALGIAKKDAQEKKICTIRVSPGHQRNGIGSAIFENLLGWLDTTAPVITVAEEKMPEFKRMLKHYGFHLTSLRNGMYRPTKVEYCFNEPSVSRLMGSKYY